MTTAEDMASSSSIPPPEQAARLADAMRPVTEAMDRLAENMRPVTEAMQSLADKMRPVAALADELGEVTRALNVGTIPVPATPLPESVRNLFRRWASMSPRQRRAALIADLRAGITRASANLRAALDRGLAHVADVMRSASPVATDAHPFDGPPLALVLLDSTRPAHGPPLPA